jgi:lambda repressor-like predicted transcriptional regulator
MSSVSQKKNHINDINNKLQLSCDSLNALKENIEKSQKTLNESKEILLKTVSQTEKIISDTFVLTEQKKGYAIKESM